MLKTRIMSALFGLPIVVMALLLRGYLLSFLVFLVSMIALYEYFNVLNNIDIKPITWFGYLLTIVYYFILVFYNINEYFNLMIYFSLLVLLISEVLFQKHNIINISLTLFGFFYVPYFFSYLIYISNLEIGYIILWLPFITAWMTDTFAYFTGTILGKHKLCPNISPKKTIEGAIGGVFGSCVFSILYCIFLNSVYYTKLNIIHFTVIGLLCGIFSQFGDLSASFIKRFTGVKDYGKIIPGHGGILDRFDSILFTAPLIYYYFYYFY